MWFGNLPRHRVGATRTLCGVGAWLLGMSSALSAQRAPILPGITLPHPYYYRELYLPQLTTGPSGVTWSPSGEELIYSMRGSLWRQAVGSETAAQLTDGPGAAYDYQPDWSSDGRFVVFVRRRPDRLQLVSLDLREGRQFVLVDSGVNVEPRFSRTGDRIAWVKMGDRAHVWVASFAGASLSNARQVTRDVDSHLPRYYYSPWDHYLSPTWSPNGDELIIVSNRGSVWGTGGLWSLSLGTGAMSPVQAEETNWKARPDWAPDGRRVVWSSYAGRQWHQLWLTNAFDGEPFALTYGDYDATGARWSPDGRRIAFISNERGNTSLWIVDPTTGTRHEVVVKQRSYRGPYGRLQVTVTDAQTGRPMPARVSITSADGRAFAPDDTWIHADDALTDGRPFEYTYFHTEGVSAVTLPTGSATLEVMRGLEFAPVRQVVQVPAQGVAQVRIALRRIDIPSVRGWISGDLHVHMNYGGTYRNTPANLARQARAEGVRVVENLIVNKESRIPDVSYFSGEPDPASTADVLIKHDEEFHTSLWGHTALLGLTEGLLVPPYAGYANTAAAAWAPLNSDVLRRVRSQGGLTGYVHSDGYPNLADTARAVTYAFPIDLAHGLVDYYEALGFVDDHLESQKLWFDALNCGYKVAAGAGTDAMANYASLRGPVGMNRIYAQVRGPLTHRSFLDAIGAGRTFATNGPLLEISVNNQTPGATVSLGPRPNVTVKVRLRSIVDVDRLELIHNGEAIVQVPMTPARSTVDTTFALSAVRTGWMALRAYNTKAAHPILDMRPMAVTSPVYIAVAGDTLRSPAVGARFATWIDRVKVAVERAGVWNSGEERTAALRTIVDAREKVTKACAGG